MEDFTDYIKIAKRVIQLENNDKTKPEFSGIFSFPFTADYITWIKLKSKAFPNGRKPRGFWNSFYNEIIDSQMIPAGVNIPHEWYQKLISFPTHCVYLIADENENLLYIGKCEYTPVIRLLDRLIPKRLNPSENNVPQIWNNYISKGLKIKYAYFYNLSFDPELLEFLLMFEFRRQKGVLPQFNKKLPSSRFHNYALKFRSRII